MRCAPDDIYTDIDKDTDTDTDTDTGIDTQTLTVTQTWALTQAQTLTQILTLTQTLTLTHTDTGPGMATAARQTKRETEKQSEQFTIDYFFPAPVAERPTRAKGNRCGVHVVLSWW